MVEDGEGNSPRGRAASLRPLKTIYGHPMRKLKVLDIAAGQEFGVGPPLRSNPRDCCRFGTSVGDCSLHAQAIREAMTEEAVLLNPALAATEATLYGFTISDSTTRSST